MSNGNRCPCCRQALPLNGPEPFVSFFDDVLIYNDKLVRLTAQQIRLMITLNEKFGRPVSTNMLVESIWPNEADQPLSAEEIIKIQICKIRKQFTKFAPELEIFTSHNYGYGLQLKTGNE